MPDLKGFQGRPTTDFGREGLFNLLSSRVDLGGAHVLDLFAGTGIVSLEFLSRGAASVTAVERAPKACRYASAQATQLGSDDLHTVCADVWSFLAKPLTQFDLVFADPPYDLDKIETLPELVASSGVLAEGGGSSSSTENVLTCPTKRAMFFPGNTAMSISVCLPSNECAELCFPVPLTP